MARVTRARVKFNFDSRVEILILIKPAKFAESVNGQSALL